MADRKQVLRQLAVYADKAAMKDLCGIDITPEQIRLAEKALAYYRQIPEADLRRMTEAEALRWPYRLTPIQRIESLMKTAGISFDIPRTLIWTEAKKAIAKAADGYDDPVAVARAVEDVEGFMKMNAYLGRFDENAAIMEDRNGKLAVLFAMAYNNHARRKGPEGR